MAASPAIEGAPLLFPGEAFLLDPTPPDYPREWSTIKAKLIVTIVLFVLVVPTVIVPLLFSSTKDAGGGGGAVGKGERRRGKNTTGASASASATTNGRGRAADGSTADVDTAKRRKPRADKRRGKGKPRLGGDSTAAAAAVAAASATTSTTTDESKASNQDDAPVVAVPAVFMPATNLLCLLSMLLIVGNSPNNRYAAKHVFHAPLLTGDDCERIIQMAHGAAERNYRDAVEKSGVVADLKGGDDDDDDNDAEGKRITDEPKGWRKDRHTSYPTTDLNLVTEAFTREDREWIGDKLDARLAPLIERVYGIAPGAIRANDMFVVRYDGKMGQQSLRVHKDSSHVSFNVLLNEEFEGGGTRYHEFRGGQKWDLKPNRGEVLLNNALVLHEGLTVTSGTRYIMVGFLNVDTKDPLTMEPIAGISPFATWLAAPWNIVRFKGGVEAARARLGNWRMARKVEEESGALRWTDNKYLISLFNDIATAFAVIMDAWAPFAFTQLVDDAKKAEYFAALDEAAAAEEVRRRAIEVGDEGTPGAPPRRRTGASWFKGQQLDVDIDGSVARLWRTRVEAGEGKFGGDL